MLGVLLLIGAAGLEATVRVRQYVKYGTAAASFYSLVLDPATGLEIPEPGFAAGPIRVDERGFRGGGVSVPKPEGTLRVVFVGGSTTFCAEASSEEATWPALVVRGLVEHYPDASIDGVNAGVAGYSTVQSQINLEERVTPLEPDVLVVYHATNDLTVDTRDLAREQGLLADASPDEESWLERNSLAWNLVVKNLRYRARREAREGPRLDFDPEQLAGAFRERLTRLVTTAQERAPLVAIATFSHRARRGQSPEEQRDACSSSLFYMPYMSVPGILDGFDAYNRVIRQVAAETGALLIEGEDTIPGDAEHFADSVHLLDPGLRLMADRVLAALIGSPELERLL